MTNATILPYIGGMETDKQIFSIWLKKAVKFEGVIQGKDLAQKIGVHPSTISGWFGGKSQGPGKALSLEICKILNAKYEEIIEIGKKEIHPPETKDPIEKENPQKPNPVKEINRLKRENELLSELVEMLKSENMRLKKEIEAGLANKPLGGCAMSDLWERVGDNIIRLSLPWQEGGVTTK